jgi:hypothetical protein
VQVWHSACQQPLLIENIKLKLRTKVESCLSCPNHSLDYVADVILSSPAFANTFVGSRYSSSNIYTALALALVFRPPTAAAD